MLCNELLELAHQLSVSADGQIDVDPVFERAQPQILEPRDRRLREGVATELGERRPAPEVERVPVTDRRGCEIPAVRSLGSLGHQTLERAQV
jgi:hypothetical protein